MKNMKNEEKIEFSQRIGLEEGEVSSKNDGLTRHT